MKQPRPRWRALPLAACSAIGLVLLSWMALVHGPGDLTMQQTWSALFDASHRHHVLVFELRLPRILAVLAAGAALALAGAVMQAVFQNPLASPEIMGTSLGAALGAAVAIGSGFAAKFMFGAPAAAFAGAALISFVVYAIAAGPGGASVTNLLLAGMAMNTLVGALISFAVTWFASDNVLSSGPILTWLMGGFEVCTWMTTLTIGAGLLLFGCALIPLWRELDLMTLRDEVAAALGVNVQSMRKLLLWIACGLTGTTVAMTGGIAFVGLVVPHICRLLVGPGHRSLLPLSAVLGAGVLLLADYLCRVVLVDFGLRLGVVTSVLGAPFFLILLVQRRRAEWR